MKVSLSVKLSNILILIFLVTIKTHVNLNPSSMKNKLSKKVDIKYQNITILDPDYYTEENYNTFSIRLFETKMGNRKCNPLRCYPPHGMCTEDGNTCKCLKGYLNPMKLDDKSYKDKYCSYKIKIQMTALVLEIVTFIGGDIYLEFYNYAVLKAICVLFLVITFWVQLPCRLCGFKDELDFECPPCYCLKTGTFILCIFGIVTWQISDVIKIFSYDAIDNNSMPLKYFP